METSTKSQNHKFMQPLLPTFLHSFSIPRSFTKHLESDLKGDPLQTVVLVAEHDPRRQWHVAVKDGRHFTDGWHLFCLHHDLQVGEFLVFTYQSQLLFHVSIFDPVSACQRISSSSHFVEPIPITTGSERVEVEFNSACASEPTEIEDVGMTAIPSKQGHCVIRLTPYNVQKAILYLPVGFVREHGLGGRRRRMTIIDAKCRVWPVEMNYKEGDGQCYIKIGWKAFLVANRITPGTLLSIQLLEGGACPTLKCSGLKRTGDESVSAFRTSPKEARGELVMTNWSEQDQIQHLCCDVLITTYAVEKPFIYLPARFVKKGGLQHRCGEVKIVDERERTWEVSLSERKDGRTYISRGWKNILTANCYMLGDVVCFQLLEAGERPTLRCYLLDSASSYQCMKTITGCHQVVSKLKVFIFRAYRVSSPDITWWRSWCINATCKNEEMHAELEMKGVSAEFDNGTDLRFVQPLIHCFLTEFSIPVSFLDQVELQLQGRLLESVVLMIEQRPHCHWLVYVQDGRHFKDGWREFCVHHHLEVGDFLVFTYQTNLRFNVTVYDPDTACQRDFPCSELPIPKIRGPRRTGVKSNLVCKTKQKEPQTELVATNLSEQDPIQYPSFYFYLSSYAVKRSIIYLPARFTKEGGLKYRRCEVKVIDEEERVWTVSLRSRNDGRPYIGRGWKHIQTVNCYKRGDVVSFQLIEAGVRPTLRCCLSSRESGDTEKAIVPVV